jgi:hypothetical protein
MREEPSSPLYNSYSYSKAYFIEVEYIVVCNTVLSTDLYYTIKPLINNFRILILYSLGVKRPS